MNNKSGEIAETYRQLEAIDFSIGGCAVLYEKETKRYYVVERPYQGMYLINGDFFYNHVSHKFDEMELLFKRNYFG